MPWNWQLPDWPNFTYDPVNISPKERQFLLASGSTSAFLKNISKEERNYYTVEILSLEGAESSKIEGELLERESLQSSIKQHFGLSANTNNQKNKESEMAELLCNNYESFQEQLTHEMLYQWHETLFKNSNNIEDIGKYRSHKEPMVIISHRLDRHQVFFEAPPSENVYDQMTQFIEWFNSTKNSESILGRAAIAHIYFESIHPFENGNGRIGRVLSEKVLSQGIGKPILIAVSKFIASERKKYYLQLGKCNRTLKVTEWVEYFNDIILKAQDHSAKLLNFLFEKSKMLNAVSGKINQRQEKALLRMFSEGPEGFSGGLSAEKYIAITKASRATATRDLSELVEKGILNRTGELKYTRYWLNISNI